MIIIINYSDNNSLCMLANNTTKKMKASYVSSISQDMLIR